MTTQRTILLLMAASVLGALAVGFVQPFWSIQDGMELGSCVMEQAIDAEPWELRELPVVYALLEEGKKSYRAVVRNANGRGFYSYAGETILLKFGATSPKFNPFATSTADSVVPLIGFNSRRVVYLSVPCHHREDEAARSQQR